MARKKRLRLDVEIDAPAIQKTRLYVDEDVADALRKVARAERMELGAFLEQVLRHWLKTKRPQWRIVGGEGT